MIVLEQCSLEDIEATLDSECLRVGCDWSIRVETAVECAWSCEIRLTPEPNADGPDRSIVFFSAGGETAVEAARDAASAALAEVARLSQMERDS